MVRAPRRRGGVSLCGIRRRYSVGWGGWLLDRKRESGVLRSVERPEKKKK